MLLQSYYFLNVFFPSIFSTPTPEINSKTEDQIKEYILVTLSDPVNVKLQPENKHYRIIYEEIILNTGRFQDFSILTERIFCK